ncbi:phosphoprotein [Babaco nucleorhabdovirus 1]|nr:phosphoprotein [Babaco nucleorhabdovirus 1]
MSSDSQVYARKLRDRTPIKPRARQAPYNPVDQEKYKKRVIEGKDYEGFNPQSLSDLKGDQQQETMPPPNVTDRYGEELTRVLKDNGCSIDDSIIKELWEETKKGIQPNETDTLVNTSVRWFLLGQTNLETQINSQNMRYAQTALPNYVTGLANTAAAMTAAVQTLEKLIPGLEKNYSVDTMAERHMMTLATSIYRSKTQAERYRVLVDFLVNEMGYSGFYEDIVSPKHNGFAIGVIKAINTDVASAVSTFGVSKFPSLQGQLKKDKRQLQDTLANRSIS